MHGEALKGRIAAPPVDGAANDSLIALLAKALGVSRRAVRIVSGESSRSKLIQVDGIDPGPIERLAARGIQP